ncbi:2,4'-dihydroxyacetophenone dioxygenase family protein [Nonomuraea sp. B19D2]|uniref:2,4'-dihydroxyacetophenone dioxygenase family protein n=1 Tax=Nonomuraea sp. B19D2 TaxID=3159561 RepID=UPI0032DA658F
MHSSAQEELYLAASKVPWVPQGDGIYFKPLRINRRAGSWINLLKVQRAGRVNRHRHLGPVEAYVLEGSWRYLERDWVAKAGDFVFEADDDIHTLEVVGDAEMITLFSIHGPFEYLDDQDNVIGTETADSKLDRYVRHCEQFGIELARIIF